MYIHLYNPLANKIVLYIPGYVAPNTLTLIGFLFTVSMFVSIFAIYGTSMEGEVSRWWYLYSAIAYFCYRMFDELDGK